MGYNPIMSFERCHSEHNRQHLCATPPPPQLAMWSGWSPHWTDEAAELTLLGDEEWEGGRPPGGGPIRARGDLMPEGRPPPHLQVRKRRPGPGPELGTCGYFQLLYDKNGHFWHFLLNESDLDRLF